MIQKVIEIQDTYMPFEKYIKEKQIKRIFLVCGHSSIHLPAGKYFSFLEQERGVKIYRFSDFCPNPIYESVKKGVRAFLESEVDCIVAIGGGSAMDVAKCIKAFSALDQKKDYLEQNIEKNQIPFIAIPTTAGTGSEATHFAVIYYKGEKISISHQSLIPELVLLDSRNLQTLPLYQRKATMFDAFSHAVESCWSVNAETESDGYAKQAIHLIMQYKNDYIENKAIGNQMMLKAAYYAGKAINITKTTAAHAMSYKLTSIYHIAHGHAAAVCLSEVWENLLQNCNDKKIMSKLQKIAGAMGCSDSMQGLQVFRGMLEESDLKLQENANEDVLELLAASVNTERMQNHPVTLSQDELKKLYRNILT